MPSSENKPLPGSIQTKNKKDDWKNVVLVPSLYPKESSQSHWDRVLAPMYTNMKPSKAERLRQVKNSRRRAAHDARERAFALESHELNGIPEAVPILPDHAHVPTNGIVSNRARLGTEESNLPNSSLPGSEFSITNLAGPIYVGPSLVGPNVCGPSLTGPSLGGQSLTGPSYATSNHDEPSHTKPNHAKLIQAGPSCVTPSGAASSRTGGY